MKVRQADLEFIWKPHKLYTPCCCVWQLWPVTRSHYSQTAARSEVMCLFGPVSKSYHSLKTDRADLSVNHEELFYTFMVVQGPLSEEPIMCLLWYGCEKYMPRYKDAALLYLYFWALNNSPPRHLAKYIWFLTWSWMRRSISISSLYTQWRE